MKNEELYDLPRWVFKKHTNSIENLIEIAAYLKNNKSSITVNDKTTMYDFFSKLPNYNPRYSVRSKPLDSMNHRLDELRYYMFGYFDKLDGEQKFIFSPLGNLFLKYIKSENSTDVSNIFLTMLFAVQFPHIGSDPSKEKFNLYPFRLIFQLLLDERLSKRLYHYEIVTEVVFMTETNKDSYNALVQRILKSRKLSKEEKFLNLKMNEHFYVTLIYEWEYYVFKILSDLDILKKCTDKLDFVELYHKQKAGSKSKPTMRKATNGYFEISKNVIEFATSLLDVYTAFDLPLELDKKTSMSGDVVKEIYSFYPKELLLVIGEDINTVANELLEIPKLIEKYSINPDNKTANLFEDALQDGFNLFFNVEVEKLSGSGRTDIECLYITKPEKFAVEAKSTQNKLSLVNAGRLRKHRAEIGAEYTILVTPRYVPSVKYDIQDEAIVIIKANTLSEYFYNSLISNNRKINYEEVRSIVVSNLGTDISKKLSELTLSKFGS